jgi:hypothetical protein
LKAAIAVIKKFPNATRIKINEFPKAARNLKQESILKMLTPEPLGNQFIHMSN